MAAREIAISAIKRVREIRLTRTALAHSKTRTSWAAALPVAQTVAAKIPQTAIMDEVSRPLPSLSARLADVQSSPVRDILKLTQRAEVISFAGGLPAPELFPAEMVAQAFATALAPTVVAGALQYSTTEGDPRLRALLAQRLTGRGLEAHADEILVTTGSQQALGLVASVLIDPGDVVLVEDPSYLAALQSFGFAGARMVPVPCDEHGVDPEQLPQLIAEHRPKFLYLVPTFQNPTGRTLPGDRRARLAQIAVEHGLWLVEDDPYGELRYDGEPLKPVASYPGARDRTVTVSTLSKVLAPGLRIGFLRAPAPLLGPMTVAKQAADLHTSTVDQHAARICLDTGLLDDHIALVRAEYRRRRDALLGGLSDALPRGSTHNHPDGGMFVWVRLPTGWDAGELLRRALEHDVAFVPGAPFYATDPDPRTLRLSFTTHRPAEIVEGLDRIRRAVA